MVVEEEEEDETILVELTGSVVLQLQVHVRVAVAESWLDLHPTSVTGAATRQSETTM